MRAGLAACSVALALCSCEPPYVARPRVLTSGTVFELASGPTSYRAPGPRDVRRAAPHRNAYGESCQYGVVLPVSLAAAVLSAPASDDVARIPPLGVVWGKGGYADALAEAHRDAAGGMLYDVRADIHFSSVLGVYVRKCVEVHASVAP